MNRWTEQRNEEGKEGGISSLPRSSFLRRLPSLAILLWAVVCSSARADVVEARGKQPLVNTQILRLQDGRLVCKGETASEISLPVEQVEYLQITGWQMLNLAEKQRRAEDWRRAAVSYEKALADLQLEPAAGAQPQTLDRVLLVKCRLISAWDAQARFERAVELYLQVIEVVPGCLETLRPSRFPETGSAVLEMAGQQVDAAIARHGQDDVGRSLQGWKASWPVRPAASAPEEGSDSPVQSERDDRRRQEIQAVARLVESGRRDQALARIKQLQPSIRGTLQADLYYWQGRALEGAESGGPTSRPADGAACARAGLAFMRVAVHYPGHPLAPECLYRAANLCRRSGQRDQAARLFSELIDVYPKAKGPDGSVWADKAREELK